MRKLIIIFIMIMTFCPFHKVFAEEDQKLIKELAIPKLLLPELYSKPRTEKITHIVIHSISNVVEKPHSPFELYDIYLLLLEYGVSTHYLIDRDGTIYQLVSDDRVAYHAGKSSLPIAPFFPQTMNEFSIGIELMGIGTVEEMIPVIPEEVYHSLNPQDIEFTEEQYTSLQLLIDNIFTRYQGIERSKYHVIGHDDYATGRKVDPGKLFDWKKIKLD